MESKTELGQRLPSWRDWQNNTHRLWWRDPGLRRCMFNIILLYGSILSYGYDGAMIGSVQALPYWQNFFGHPSGIKLGLIVAAYLFPQCIFPYACSWLADWIGRKKCVTLLCLFGIAGPLTSALGNGLGSFVTGRVLTGISTSFAFVVAPSLISEIAHPRFRAVVAATLWSSFTIGTFICGWVGFGALYWESNWSWRLVTILQMSAVVFMLPFTFTPFMVESPRWLIKQGRHNEALQVLADLHANGDSKDELVVREYAEIEAAIRLEANTKQGSVFEFFQSRGNMHRFAILVFFGWATSMSGQNLLAYYLPLILGVAGFNDAIQVQGIQAGTFANLMLAAFAGGLLVERVGRVKLLRFSLIASAVCWSIFTGLTAGYVEDGGHATAIAVVPFLFFLGSAFTVGIYPVAFVYMPEMLPYHLRTVGLSVFTILTNAGAVCASIFLPLVGLITNMRIVNGLVNPVAIDAIGWKYYLIFVVGDVIQAVIGWFLIVETKGLTLEDIAILFDGDSGQLDESQMIASNVGAVCVSGKEEASIEHTEEKA